MLYIYCEGLTEKLFVTGSLNPYLVSLKRVAAIPVGSQGLQPFARVHADLIGLLSNRNARVTTLIDYYGMPSDYPGMPHQPSPSGNRGAVYDDVARLEIALAAAINSPRFIPHYSLHEIEALAFVSPLAIAEQRRRFPGASIQAQAQSILEHAQGNPEWVNDSEPTSPSHRLQGLWPTETYQKTVDTIGIIRRISFSDLLSQCSHFAGWVAKL